MHDDKWRAESLGEIDGLKSLFNRTFAFFSIRGRELVAIRRSVHHFHRQWTKVMQTAEFHFAGLIHFLNSRHERNANAMSKLHPIESEIDDLAQHFGAIGVPARVPTGRERDHVRSLP